MDTFVNYETDWRELRDSIRKRAELIPTCRGDFNNFFFEIYHLKFILLLTKKLLGDTKRTEIKLALDEIEECEEIV